MSVLVDAGQDQRQLQLIHLGFTSLASFLLISPRKDCCLGKPRIPDAFGEHLSKVTLPTRARCSLPTATPGARCLEGREPFGPKLPGWMVVSILNTDTRKFLQTEVQLRQQELTRQSLGRCAEDAAAITPWSESTHTSVPQQHPPKPIQWPPGSLRHPCTPADKTGRMIPAWLGFWLSVTGFPALSSAVHRLWCQGHKVQMSGSSLQRIYHARWTRAERGVQAAPPDCSSGPAPIQLQLDRGLQGWGSSARGWEGAE